MQRQHLNHPRIPRYRDYFQVEQSPNSALCLWGLVQDYIPGTSLQDLLEKGTRFGEQDVWKIAEQTLQILVYLHSLCSPVLHRDIKPSNLMLDQQSGKVWLIDFGAVQNQAAAINHSFTVVGTVGYAPLEQFWGRAIAASDLYALGATLIHLLTGVAPVDLPQRNLRIQFRDLTTVNSRFIRWVEKLTEPAFERRFNRAQDALTGLEQAKTKTLSVSNKIRESQTSWNFTGIAQRCLQGWTSALGVGGIALGVGGIVLGVGTINYSAVNYQAAANFNPLWSL
jgi:serine/threonine protein kinase